MWYSHYLIIGFVNMMFAADLKDDRNVSCGIDFTGISPVIEGQHKLENYPWIGILIYPMGHSNLTSVVVLVTRQMAIGSASEIDKIPKHQFRAKARVALGTKPFVTSVVRVREYTYHSDYTTSTVSALALIQLDMDHLKFELYPICGPPTHFADIHIHALSLNQDTENPVVTIHEMEHVNDKECNWFYRKERLDMDSLWPVYNTCARAVRDKRDCVWRSGAALAAKLGNRWHLLGFGIYGPGCRAPSRFIDYGAYLPWVKRSVVKIGKPAVTRLGPGHIILRRTMSNLQRFGRCDKEEVAEELYSDKFTIPENDDDDKLRRVRYNITLFDGVDYSCVIFKVFHEKGHPTPTLSVRRWCPDPNSVCYRFQFIQTDFYIDIDFVAPVAFKMAAFGHRPAIADPKKILLNMKSERRGGKKNLIADTKFKKHLESSKHMFWTKKPKSKSPNKQVAVVNYQSEPRLNSQRRPEEFFLV